MLFASGILLCDIIYKGGGKPAGLAARCEVLHQGVTVEQSCDRDKDKT
jgi:hypothetical protein